MENKKPSPDDEVHVIDGIVELNHPAPFWWQMIFYISMVWALGYMAYYLVGDGQTLKESLAQKLYDLDAKKNIQKVSPEDEKKELFAYFKSHESLEQGHVVFQKNCTSCHANDGGGGIGPNLTDSYWISGDGTIDSIFKVVRDGVSEKGMPPWGPLLKREETLKVAAFVRSLRGQVPAKPKAPQGALVNAKQEI